MDTRPVDLKLVLDDDQLINALADGRHRVSDDELTRLLEAWRNDCRRARAGEQTEPWRPATVLATMRAGVANYLDRNPT